MDQTLNWNPRGLLQFLWGKHSCFRQQLLWTSFDSSQNMSLLLPRSSTFHMQLRRIWVHPRHRDWDPNRCLSNDRPWVKLSQLVPDSTTTCHWKEVSRAMPTADRFRKGWGGSIDEAWSPQVVGSWLHPPTLGLFCWGCHRCYSNDQSFAVRGPEILV